MSEKIKDIITTAWAMKADIGQGKTIEDLNNKYKEFKNKNEKIFNSICTDRNAINILLFMLNLKEREERGEITAERGHVEMGEFMAKLYLPTEEQLNSRV
tara:strand:+ start:1661 stop:1960 length:300 start_codon:yes stop_codon:yes gene_type:complete